MWTMNGSTVTSTAAPTEGAAAIAPDSSWSVAGGGDFNFDGMSDLLWRNSSGALSLWTMNGSVITSSASITSGGTAITPDASWSVAGVGDFDGDGVVDFQDLLLLVRDYGQSLSPAQSAAFSPAFRVQLEQALADLPEPADLAFITSLLFLLARRRIS